MAGGVNAIGNLLGKVDASNALVVTVDGGVAPVAAQYVTLAALSGLSDERILTAGTGIALTDAGAGSTVTVEATRGLLASTAYNPATPASTDTVSATFADVDATNLTVTFTVPASGAVLIRLSAVAVVDAAVVYVWNLRTPAAANVVGSYGVVSATTSMTRAAVAVVITGLTPAASVTYRWGHAVASNTGFIRYGDDGSTITTRYGPAVMEVWGA